MPRAGWNGFLRLSLVTCPVYLRPDTAEVKRICAIAISADPKSLAK
jgi:non-homologous end joining protein Ku